MHVGCCVGHNIYNVEERASECPMASIHDQENVAIFWDCASARPVSNMSGYDAVKSIASAAQTFGAIKLFKAYADFSGQTSTKMASLRLEIQMSGVSVVDIPTTGRKTLADKIMMIDMIAHAMDHAYPQTFLVITSDKDFAYAIGVLRLRRYRVVVLSSALTHASLSSQASVSMDWSKEGLDLETNEAAQPSSPPENGRSKSFSLRSRADSTAEHPAGPSGLKRREMQEDAESINIQDFRARSRGNSVFSRVPFVPDRFELSSDAFASPRPARTAEFTWDSRPAARPMQSQVRADSAPPSTYPLRPSPPASTAVYKTPGDEFPPTNTVQTPAVDMKGKEKAVDSSPSFFPRVQTAFDYLSMPNKPTGTSSLRRSSIQSGTSSISASATSEHSASDFSELSAQPGSTAPTSTVAPVYSEVHTQPEEDLSKLQSIHAASTLDSSVTSVTVVASVPVTSSVAIQTSTPVPSQPLELQPASAQPTPAQTIPAQSTPAQSAPAQPTPAQPAPAQPASAPAVKPTVLLPPQISTVVTSTSVVKPAPIATAAPPRVTAPLSVPTSVQSKPLAPPAITSPPTIALGPAAKVVPPKFIPLVKTLEKLHAKGHSQVDRGVVALELMKVEKGAYTQAKVTGFKQYSKLAATAGIVNLGHNSLGGEPWISLKPEWRGIAK
ncbi:NYN domain-containing protein [Crucibulum laeve]|uniref:NYN domain-containing protein n=1 Tax=Crucibulum laeve TaxID=68775 RepID=A0A5C3MBS8_9AGAR|nr:NYN domain-containing protein [Crucibulum laeve]